MHHHCKDEKSCLASLIPKPSKGRMRVRTHTEKALLTLCVFTSRNLAIPYIIVKDQGNEDTHWICHQGCPPSAFFIQGRAWRSVVCISAWASALLVLTIRAMPELLGVGRVTRELPRFFVCRPLENTKPPAWEFAGQEQHSLWQKSISTAATNY